MESQSKKSKKSAKVRAEASQSVRSDDSEEDQGEQLISLSESQLRRLIQKQVSKSLKLSEGQSSSRERLVLGASRSKEPMDIMSEAAFDPAKIETGLTLLRQKFGKVFPSSVVYDTPPDKKELFSRSKSFQQDLARTFTTLQATLTSARERLSDEEAWTLECVCAFIGLLEISSVHTLWKLHLEKLGPSVPLVQRSGIISRNWPDRDLSQASDEIVMLEKELRHNKTIETFITFAKKQKGDIPPRSPTPQDTSTSAHSPSGRGRGTSFRGRGNRNRGGSTNSPAAPETAPSEGGEAADE